MIADTRPQFRSCHVKAKEISELTDALVNGGKSVVRVRRAANTRGRAITFPSDLSAVTIITVCAALSQIVRTCDAMTCDGRLPRWATTLARDNKGNMKIARDKRITVILSGLSYLHRLNRLRQLGD